MQRGYWIVGGVATLTVVALAAAAYVQRAPRSPFDGVANAQPTASADDEYIARLADCVACHSTPDGAPFAGGLKMGTPMGALYSTNITPDPETGIGRYTLADFDNAVRRGVAKDGHRLYPAMPYPSFAKLTDGDVRKLYGYFMLQVKPVRQSNRPPEIGFPFNQRWGLAIWNGLFLRDRPYQVKAEHDEAWNRGAYLVQGPGHCGACHTPRGLAFNEKALDERSDNYLAGALLDAWYASNLRGDAVLGLGKWTEQDIVQYLKVGRNVHGVVYGSMLDAFNNSTQFMSDADLTAIARYLKSLSPVGQDVDYAYDGGSTAALNAYDVSSRGAQVYLTYCGTCHGNDGKGRADLLPPLAGNSGVLQPDPASLINIVLNGAGRLVVNGVPDSYRMTPFRALLSDQDVADVATFIRKGWGNAAGTVEASQVQKLREATDPSSDHVIVLRMR